MSARKIKPWDFTTVTFGIQFQTNVLYLVTLENLRQKSTVFITIVSLTFGYSKTKFYKNSFVNYKIKCLNLKRVKLVYEFIL